MSGSDPKGGANGPSNWAHGLLWGSVGLIAGGMLASITLLRLLADFEGSSAWQLLFGGVQAFAATFTAIALFAAFAQVRMTKKQLSDSRTWNKMTFALSFLPSNDMLFKWEETLDDSIVKLIQRSTPLTSHELAELDKPENEPIRRTLKSYLKVVSHGVV